MTRFNPYRIRLCIICTILPGQTVFARQETNFRNPVMKYFCNYIDHLFCVSRNKNINQ